MDFEGNDIKLSAIIICLNQWEFIWDAIASLEACLETVDEILIACSPVFNPDEQELLTYLRDRGYVVCEFNEQLNLAEILNFSIEQAGGKYIFPLFAHNTICSDTLIDAVEILDENPQVGVVYGDVEFFGKENRTEVLPDFSSVLLLRNNSINLSSLFRKKLWEDCESFSDRLVDYLCNKYRCFYDKHGVEPFQNERINLAEISVKEHPLVSVCIPTFNGSRFVAEAISSILSQTYSPLEIIISDDGSADNTVEIAKSFQENTSVELSIFSHEPLGLAENSNFAVSQAKGNYIKFLFQDDLLSPYCIEEMVKLAERDAEIGLVFSPREICFVDEVAQRDRDLISIYHDFQNIHLAWSNLQPVQPGKNLLTDPHLLKHPINKIGEPSTVLIRREAWERVGGFDPQLNQLVDLDLWLRIMGSYKVGFVNQVLSYFRLHTQQKTYQNINENLSNDLQFYQKLYSGTAYNFLPEIVRDRALCIYTINLNHFYLYCSDNSSGTFLEDMRLLRRELAEYWLKVSPDELKIKLSTALKIPYLILLRNKRLRAETLTESEQIFLKTLAEKTANLPAGCQPTGTMLVQMLYPN